MFRPVLLEIQNQLCVFACFLSELHCKKLRFYLITILKKVWNNSSFLSLNETDLSLNLPVDWRCWFYCRGELRNAGRRHFSHHGLIILIILIKHEFQYSRVVSKMCGFFFPSVMTSVLLQKYIQGTLDLYNWQKSHLELRGICEYGCPLLWLDIKMLPSVTGLLTVSYQPNRRDQHLIMKITNCSESCIMLTIR